MPTGGVQPKTCKRKRPEVRVVIIRSSRCSRIYKMDMSGSTKVTSAASAITAEVVRCKRSEKLQQMP
jgi:hypothetical protein